MKKKVFFTFITTIVLMNMCTGISVPYKSGYIKKLNNQTKTENTSILLRVG